MGCREYLVGVLVFALLVWGPIDHSWPAWVVIRTGYLIAIPVAIWFFLAGIWRVWQPDVASENRLKRILAGATSAALLVLAFFEAVADTHVGNTKYVRSYTGTEAVGDLIILPGPDWFAVVILLAASGFSLWISISKGASKQ